MLGSQESCAYGEAASAAGRFGCMGTNNYFFGGGCEWRNAIAAGDHRERNRSRSIARTAGAEQTDVGYGIAVFANHGLGI